MTSEVSPGGARLTCRRGRGASEFRHAQEACCRRRLCLLKGIRHLVRLSSFISYRSHCLSVLAFYFYCLSPSIKSLCHSTLKGWIRPARPRAVKGFWAFVNPSHTESNPPSFFSPASPGPALTTPDIFLILLLPTSPPLTTYCLHKTAPVSPHNSSRTINSVEFPALLLLIVSLTPRAQYH